MSENPTGVLRSFPKVFWIANVMELFERAAYYGLNAVLAIYLTNAVTSGGLGFSEQSVGFLQGLIYALTYVVPIVGGALADRYGYRRMLLFAFSLMTVGYFVAGQVTSYGAVLGSLTLLAAGAGLFKPIISGTIARSTNESSSGLGFGIYYWMINVGAFIAPLVVSLVKGFSWTYVFIASAAYTAAMLIPAVFIYRDPPMQKAVSNLRKVLEGAAIVLADSRFMLMIVLYSGFWVLYFQNFGSILWFLRDFIDATPVNLAFASIGIPLKFDAEHVTVVNAGTIILLQVVVSRIVQKAKPLVTMISGMFLGVVGFVCLAFASTIWVFIAGIVIFSIGEMTAHPKYFSYVGLVAPSDRKAVYMGYSFLYGVVGSLLGSNLGGAMYESMLKPIVGTPDPSSTVRLFWLLFAGLGMLAIVGLLIYHRRFSADTPEANAKARRWMAVIYLLLVAVGLWFSVDALRAEEVGYKLLVQAGIMLLIGGGGLWMMARRR